MGSAAKVPPDSFTAYALRHWLTRLHICEEKHEKQIFTLLNSMTESASGPKILLEAAKFARHSNRSGRLDSVAVNCCRKTGALFGKTFGCAEISSFAHGPKAQRSEERERRRGFCYVLREMILDIILNEKIDIDSAGKNGVVKLTSGKTLPADLLVRSLLKISLTSM
jgi:hypothetical protein